MASQSAANLTTEVSGADIVPREAVPPSAQRAGDWAQAGVGMLPIGAGALAPALMGGLALGILAGPAARGKLMKSKISGGTVGDLPMDEVSRMARAKGMGYSDDVIWRAEANGRLPSRYQDGGFFSRDRDYAAGFAQKGGQPDPREFRLDLSKAFTSGKPMTAGEYGRLVESAMAHDPQLAAQLARQFDVPPEYMVGFGKARPDPMIADGPSATLTHETMSKSRASEQVFKGAGFNAIDSGRDVRNLDGFGVRSAQAVFTPGKAGEQGILLSLGAVSPWLFEMASRPDPKSDQH